MAQLKDLLVTGDTRLLGNVYANIYTDRLKPFITKTYTDIIGDGNTNAQANNGFLFGSIKPDSYTMTWEVRYRVRVWVPSNSNYEATSEVLFIGDQASINAQAIFNHFYSTSYRPVYYHQVYRLKSAGFTNGYGHAIGISLSDSTNRADTSLKRSFTVEVLSQKNCTVTLNDTAVKYVNWPGTGTTNYNDVSTYNFSSNGLMETGDNDDTCQLRSYYERPLVDTGKLYGYSLCTLTSDNKLTGFVTSYSTGTTKTKNTATFKINAPIYYYASSTEKAAGSYTNDNTLVYQTSSVNLQYSTNCGTTLTANQPVYLVGVPSGTTYTLADTWWTQTLPSTEDGKIYIYLGIAYNNYQIAWQINHPIYWYKDGAVKLYIPSAGDLAYIAKGSGSSKFLREDGTWQTVSGGSATDVQINGTSITSSNVANILTNSAYSSSNKIATMSDLPTNTDAKVAQTATTTSAAYELLFSETADNTTRTEGARKTSTLTYNPSTKALSTGGTVNGLTLTAASTGFTIAGGTTSKTLTVNNTYTLGGACAKSVDTSISAGSSSANLPTSAAVATFVEGKGYVTTDTKNTAGSTDSSSKLFLIGATSQAANPQTYSQDTTYVGTDGHLYSNSVQVVNLSGSQALTNKTYNGYTLAAACAKAVVTSVDTSASLPTSNAVKTFVEGKGYKKITYGYVDPTGGSTDDIYIQLA